MNRFGIFGSIGRGLTNLWRTADEYQTIVPGVMSDIMALVLLSPAGKWLARIFIASFFLGILPRLSPGKFNYQSFDEKSAKDEIIDVKVVNAGKEKSDNEP